VLSCIKINKIKFLSLNIINVIAQYCLEKILYFDFFSLEMTHSPQMWAFYCFDFFYDLPVWLCIFYVALDCPYFFLSVIVGLLLVAALIVSGKTENHNSIDKNSENKWHSKLFYLQIIILSNKTQ
jgi:hypothetical protein